MSRGICAIGLHQPKDPINVGQVLRAAGCYEASMVVVSGGRYTRRRSADTQAAHKHLPLLTCEYLRDALPLGAVPVAVELVDGAVPLHTYRHPESAFYLFGPEDGSLDASVLSWCRDVVYVPTRHCLNLAMTVNTVLYDRAAKSKAWSGISLMEKHREVA